MSYLYLFCDGWQSGAGLPEHFVTLFLTVCFLSVIEKFDVQVLSFKFDAGDW